MWSNSIQIYLLIVLHCTLYATPDHVRTNERPKNQPYIGPKSTQHVRFCKGSELWHVPSIAPTEHMAVVSLWMDPRSKKTLPIVFLPFSFFCCFFFGFFTGRDEVKWGKSPAHPMDMSFSVIIVCIDNVLERERERDHLQRVCMFSQKGNAACACAPASLLESQLRGYGNG